MAAQPQLLTDLLTTAQDARPAAPQNRYGCAYGCGRALFAVELQQRAQRPMLIVADSVSAAEALVDEVRFFAAGAQVAHYPDPETLPYDSFSPHPDLVSSRLALLAQLLTAPPDIIVVAAPTLAFRLPPRDYIQTYALQLHVGQSVDLGELRERLANAGYDRVNQVSQAGEYAVRGSLIDLYAAGMADPVRIDFFDEEIESIRSFDPDTQRSAGALERIDLLPARDFPVDDEGIRAFRGRYRERFAGNPAESVIYSEVTERRFPGGIENYFPLFFDASATFWDYLPADTMVLGSTDLAALLAANWSEIESRYEQYRHDTERPALAPDELFVPPTAHAAALQTLDQVTLETHESPASEVVNLPLRRAPALMINTHAEQPVAELLQFLRGYSGRTLIAAESAGRRELLTDLLREHSMPPRPVSSWQEFVATDSRLAIAIAPLTQGVVHTAAELCVIAETELFGGRPGRRKRRKLRDPESILTDLSDLRTGSPVVHEEYGVGRYRGLKHLEIDAVPAEFLTLEYAGGDLLYVPVGSLHLISRYTGSAPEHAPLHRLGTDQWTKARRKAAEQIRDVAAEMLDLYATRAARSGRSMRAEPLDYERFCSAFPFELTDDQARAVDATLHDMQQPQSMDRLVCGDVGFGKTEVALRAAFIAAMSGAQVALLAPTTLLAQQHYQTFCDRFADWPITVEVLSRFRSAKETRQVVTDLQAGKVDIVVGTHRLLQKDIKFSDLGLVIVDEEHRFGVKHKERLKALRAEVDLLTLTATPIPRTLNMALGELRELSLITTPPESRLAIKTFVTQWRDTLLQEACQREMKRGGQIFFVHNRIQDIEQQADRLQQLVPDAEIRVAHGQMREQELEQIMADFYHRRFHILVCTAIIESGIDIPSANTIIINRADHFGLAQLHQLRGRVGRSHHKAFAYLLAPPRERMTADAAKRLDAIEAMEDLGAGFVLATHDLEIRGAGELLGENQTGQLQQIGFALYTELLGRAVQAIRRGDVPDLEATQADNTEVNLHLPALLPEDYMPDVQMRLSQYKRIASAPDAPALQELQVEIIDRFGLLPPPTRNLFRQAQIRLLAARLGIRKLEGTAGGITVQFGAEPRVDTGALVQLIAADPSRYRFDRQQRFIVQAGLTEDEARFTCVEQLLRDWAEELRDEPSEQRQ